MFYLIENGIVKEKHSKKFPLAESSVIYWVDSKIEDIDIGQEYDSDLEEFLPDPSISIDSLQVEKVNILKKIRDAKVYAPIEYESNLIPCSEKAKIGITGKLAYWNGETNNTFVDVYGNKLTWTKTKFKAVAKLIDQQQTPLFEKAGAIEQQIMAIADIGELKNFDVQVTWDDM